MDLLKIFNSERTQSAAPSSEVDVRSTFNVSGRTLLGSLLILNNNVVHLGPSVVFWIHRITFESGGLSMAGTKKSGTKKGGSKSGSTKMGGMKKGC